MFYFSKFAFMAVITAVLAAKDCAGARCPAVGVQAFPGTACSAVKHVKTHRVYKNECENWHGFSSFKVFEHNWRRRPDMKNLKCTLHAFEEKHCRGAEFTTGDVRDLIGHCNPVNITSSGLAGQRPARSIKLLCEPYSKPAVSSSSSASTSSHASTSVAAAGLAGLAPFPSRSSSTTPPQHESTTVDVVFSSKVAVDIGMTKTVTTTATPPVTTVTSTSTSSSTSSVHTVSVQSTTTIVVAPTATVSGTTTVWVRPSSISGSVSSGSTTSSRKIRTIASTSMQTITEDNDLEARHAEATETPALIRRASANGTECYASVDGHWVVSTCELPKPTQT